MAEEVTVSVRADTAPFQAALKDLEWLAGRFSSQLTGGLRSAVAGGQELDDILRRIALNLSSMALDRALQPLSGMFGGFLSSMMGAVMPFARGGVVPFADGGVVSAPSYFPMRTGVGLMGEAGPEAILPLQRTADGRLGVASGGGGQSVNVVFNVSTPDAGSFRKSEAQVSAMLARAVARGSKAM